MFSSNIRTVFIMKRIFKIEVSIALGLIVALLISTVSFAIDCKEIRSNVVRLHVLANSDSPEDQQVKLLVRDALLESGAEIFSGAATADDAADFLEKEKAYLVSVAKKVLADNGFGYGVRIELVREYFTTRTYGEYTLPAGEYLALKVMLGNSGGHNWWCVMFPPLCLPAASDETDVTVALGEKGTEIIRGGEKYEVRFKAVELYEKIKNRILN